MFSSILKIFKYINFVNLIIRLEISIGISKASLKTPAVRLKLASTVNDSKELFWSSSYDNENETQVLCADEWFRAIPNTI